MLEDVEKGRKRKEQTHGLSEQEIKFSKVELLQGVINKLLQNHPSSPISSAEERDTCKCERTEIKGEMCGLCGLHLYANDSDGWISLDGKSAKELKELFKGTELELDGSIDTHIASESLGQPKRLFTLEQVIRLIADYTAETHSLPDVDDVIIASVKRFLSERFKQKTT